ncbi:hypothetical protein Gotri_020899 [Gossypium trilobum]|uniref:Uncharacterized protein n=1 Tax=Gossypium trilobum TaxID=34281 RepID=A0A7J9DAR2_9ROSI|nr:hypothetical protein [Gossypium trilobum]
MARLKEDPDTISYFELYKIVKKRVKHKEDENVYLMKMMYFSDGDDDEELQEARQKLREVEGETSGEVKETVVDETEVPEEVEGERLNDRVGRE